MSKRILIAIFLLAGCAQGQAPSTTDFSIKAYYNGSSESSTNQCETIQVSTTPVNMYNVPVGEYTVPGPMYTPPPTNSDSDNCDDNPNLSICL